MTDDRADHLGFVLVALDEERPDWPVDQTRGQGFLFRRTAFAFKKTAGNLPGSEGLFLIVHGQRKEIHARAGALLSDRRAEHDGVAIGRHNGAISLTGNLARFQGQLAAAPLDFFFVDIKHFLFGPSNLKPDCIPPDPRKRRRAWGKALSATRLTSARHSRTFRRPGMSSLKTLLKTTS